MSESFDNFVTIHKESVTKYPVRTLNANTIWLLLNHGCIRISSLCVKQCYGSRTVIGGFMYFTETQTLCL